MRYYIQSKAEACVYENLQLIMDIKLFLIERENSGCHQIANYKKWKYKDLKAFKEI